MPGPGRREPKIALRWPILSEPPDLADLVRNSRIQVKGRFQRDQHWLWFEPHLPEIRPCPAKGALSPSASPSDPDDASRRGALRSYRLQRVKRGPQGEDAGASLGRRHLARPARVMLEHPARCALGRRLSAPTVTRAWFVLTIARAGSVLIPCGLVLASRIMALCSIRSPRLTRSTLTWTG